MTDPSEIILVICVIAAILGLGTMITLGNERVRQATLQVRQVAHEYALADLALRREQVRRSITFSDENECLRALEQIALDATRGRHELTSLTVAPGGVAALMASERDGTVSAFTPSAEAFLRANRQYGRRRQAVYPVNGLNSNPFVIEELEAIARWCGLNALPRSTEWDLIVMPSEDYSLLPRRGLFHFLSGK